jgi:DNA-binding PadR family transcriptional regulator
MFPEAFMVVERVGNLLGLAVLSLLRERPMHPYEISSLMRERGLSASIKLNYGSLYSVIEGLRAKGLIAVKATQREGNHPERTIYQVTEAGVTELLDRLRYLVGTPVKEYPRFVAGLTFLAQLEPSTVLGLLDQRVGSLSAGILDLKGVLDPLLKNGLERLYLIEIEYELAMMRAELDWVRSFMADIEKGELATEAAGSLRWKALAGISIQGD